MKLDAIVRKIGAVTITPTNVGNIEINRIYAGNKMSDILNEATSDTLVVTDLNNQQLIRAAELMDVKVICLLRDTVPARDILTTVERYGTVILSSPYGMYETCGRLYQCFLNNNREADEHSFF